MSNSWHRFKEGNTVGENGSEGGRILKDEEFNSEARITIERGDKLPEYAITCGIYGWMVHTRYFSEEKETFEEYEAMKKGLVRILDLIPPENDLDKEAKFGIVVEEIQAFVERYP